MQCTEVARLKTDLPVWTGICGRTPVFLWFCLSFCDLVEELGLMAGHLPQVADGYLWDTFVLANEEVFLPWCAVRGGFFVLYNLQGAAQSLCSYVSNQIQDKLQQDRIIWWTFQVNKNGVRSATPNPVPCHNSKDELSCGNIQWYSTNVLDKRCNVLSIHLQGLQRSCPPASAIRSSIKLGQLWRLGSVVHQLA